VVDLPIGAARLLLAGHTHGGQIRLLPSGRLPLVHQIRRLRGLRPLPPLPFARGWHWSRGAVVIISDGLGQSTLGVRFRTRPELVLIELADAPLDGPPCDDARRYVTYQGDEPRLLRWLT
jgi:predicted MPP superfamily phosphohydrolase